MKVIAKILGVVLGVAVIIMGLYCLFTPGITYLALGYCVGLSMILDAVGDFFFWLEAKRSGESNILMLISSIVSLVLGFFILNSAILQLSIDLFIAYYVAIWLIVRGGIIIGNSVQMRRYHKEWDTIKVGKHWYLPMVIGILMILFGLLCCFNPTVIASAIGIFIGLGIITSGVNLVAISLVTE